MQRNRRRLRFEEGGEDRLHKSGSESGKKMKRAWVSVARGVESFISSID